MIRRAALGLGAMVLLMGPAQFKCGSEVMRRARETHRVSAVRVRAAPPPRVSTHKSL